MNMKKKVILTVGIALFVIAGMAAATLIYALTERADIMSAEEIYADVADKVDKFSFDEDSGLIYVNNEVVVIAAEGTDKGQVERLAVEYGGEISDAMDDVGVYCFTFSGKMKPDEIDSICEKLKEEDGVEDAYLNPVIMAQADSITVTDGEVEDRKPVYPDDGWGDDSWDESVPRGNNWGVEAIHAPSAWAYLDELSEVNAGLIDAMPTTEHDDLDIRVFYTLTDGESNYSVTTEHEEVLPNSAYQHGCHVAGIIGAGWNNAGEEGDDGVSGVAGDKVHMYYSDSATLSEHYNGAASKFYSAYDYVKAIKVLVNNDVRAINISLNTGRLEGFAASKGNKNAINLLKRQADVAERMLKRIIDDIKQNGGNDFVICIAAGNSNSIRYYKDDSAVYGYVTEDEAMPWHTAEVGGSQAVYNNFLSLIDDADVVNRIIVVGSVGVDPTTSTAGETRYKYSGFSCIGSRVDVVAPGENIYSLDTVGCVSLGGTSMATPHVTGVAALAFAADPTLTGPEVKTLIVSLTNGRYYYEGGYAGMVDAEKVVKAALAARETGHIQVVTNATGLDLCFVVDTTGSMGDDIQNAKENMVDILSKLSEKSDSYRVGLVDYRDFSSRTHHSDDYPAQVKLDFSDNDEEIVAAINSLDLGSGGDENETVYSGLHEALTMSWRARAKKVIIILGDAPPLDPEPVTGYTYDDVILALYNADIGIDLESSDSRVLGEPDASAINVYSIGIDVDSVDFFDSIAEDTGGEHTDIESADEVSDAIIQSIDEIEIEASETELDFGKSLSRETVEIYLDDEYEFSITLDEEGAFVLANAAPGEYDWEIKRLGRSGSVSISEEDGEADLDKGKGKWYTFALVVWYRHRVALFLIPLGGAALIVAVIFLLKFIKKMREKSKARKCCPVCGAEIKSGIGFCGACGTPVNRSSRRQ